MSIADYIVVVDDVLDPVACDEIMSIYNEKRALHQRFDVDSKPSFTQLNLTANKDVSLNLHDYIVEISQRAIEFYKTKVPSAEYFPQRYAFEEFRVKHYANDGIDQFDTHVDSASLNTSKRFLVFFWYLNDVAVGGETIFPELNISVKPNKGRLLMFPPYWMYPHKGNIPISNEKFLLSSYLHYA